MKSHYLFVYGTLKKGYTNNRLLGAAKYLGTADTQGTLYNLGSFPGLRLEGENVVFGELYLIPEQLLEVLDYLEGVPYLYTRETIKVNFASESIGCMVYVIQPDHIKNSKVIASGSWK